MARVAKTQRSGPAPERAQPGVADRLLAWYDIERRELPWRAKAGAAADPYRVWLSEIMLQQTTVKAVIPYYERFLQRFPSVRALAQAPLDEVLEAWAGLGYYSRARSLHKAACMIVAEHEGRFPSSEIALRELPGIGPYTAAAIAAIAFGQKATPVDGNIERVVARLMGETTPLPKAKPAIKARAIVLTPDKRAGDYAQAMMDLGSAVCTPRRPSCLMCPLHTDCSACARGIEDDLPVRAPKKARPVRRSIAFLALSEDGRVLLRRRPETGLLARMLEVPSTPWETAVPEPGQAVQSAPVVGDWWRVPGLVEHTFTHFKLEAEVLRAIVPKNAPLTFWAQAHSCRWVERKHLSREALPSVMRKLISHGLRELGD